MKKFVVFLLFLLPLMATAGPIDLQSAKKTAGTFLKEKIRSKTVKSVNLAYRQPIPGHEEQTACYVFNSSDGKGYVVVSGDDRTEQVLGYSSTGHIDPSAMPDNMKYYLGELAKEIASIKSGGTGGGRKQIMRIPVKKAITPLITTHWDQRSPFYNMTPTVTNSNGETEHCVTGCVATALAQLMNFYKYPDATLAEIPGYTSETLGFKLDAIPAGTTIDWNNMVDTYNSSSTAAQCNAVAKLMYLCGVSMKMDYTLSASGAFISIKALTNYFGYGSQAKLCEKVNYTPFEWFNLIYDELAKGYPMYSEGGNHAYVIDGYDGDNMFHFNWGWGPNSDGYYLLSAVSEYYPEGSAGSTAGYTSGQRVLTGLRTTSAESPKIESIVKLDSQVDNNTLKVEVTHPAKLAEESAYGIGYMKDDRSVVPISVCYEEWPYYANLTVISTYPLKIRGLSKGSYRVVAIKKDEGSSVWKASEDTEKSFADVNVDGNGNVTTTLYGYTTDIKVDTMVFISEPTFGSNNIKAYVSKSIDDGMTYDGDVSLYSIQETPVGTNSTSTSYYDTKSVILKKGETKCLDFSAFISGKYFGASDADSLFTFRFYQGSSKGKKIGDFKVLVKKSPKISRNLAMTMTPTIESFNTSQNYLYGKSLKMKVQVVNENDSDYVGYVQARAYIGNRYSWEDKAIYLPAGGQTEVEFDLWSDGFPDNASSCRLELKNWCSNGFLSFTETENSTFEPWEFTLRPGIKVYYDDGTSKCFEATTSYSAPKNATAIDIRDQNTLKSLTRANPNCLVFTDDYSGTPSGVTTNIVKSSKSDNITLTDGYSFATPMQFTATNISYTRTFTKAYRPNGTGWTTICLPFDVTSVKVKNGSTSTAIDWFHSNTDTGKSFWVREFSEEDAPMMRFAPANKMLAAHPYIISFPDANSGIGKTLTGKPVTFYGSQTVIKPTFRCQTLGYTFRMKGVTSSSTVNLGFGHNDGDTLFVKNSPLSVPAFRAYFEPVTSSAQTRARLILAGEAKGAIDDPAEQEDKMELVDLGLSVKWASKNLSAFTAERPGVLVAWGELAGKSSYSSSNYEHIESYYYYKDIGSSIAGTQYDAAYSMSGGKYRIPTKAEMQELLDRCTITNEIVDGIDGFRVKGPNGNSIFMPASGYKNYNSYEFASDKDHDNICGFYWTSDSYSSNTSKQAYSLIIGTDGTRSITNTYRYNGLAIRPVEMTENPVGPVVPVEPEAIDLGLSTNWATFNVGAATPEASGNMVAWGETEPKSTYSWGTYTYANGTASSVKNIGSDISGTEYDFATKEWGDDWRMPTQEEVKELMDKCTFTNTIQNGVKGCTVTGPNGKSIFLPYSGCNYDGALRGEESSVYYWSGTLDGSNDQRANSFSVTNSSGASVLLCQRRTGMFVRPVQGHHETPEVKPEEIDLGLGTKWASFNLGATSPSETGDMVAWGETGPKSTYTWGNYTHGNGTASSVRNIGNEISDTEYDAAAQTWGDGWRLPTTDEINELRTKCTFTQTTVNGVMGYRVTGPNGKNIFLPLGGCSYDGASHGEGTYAFYWSGDVDGGNAQKASVLYLKSGSGATSTVCQRRTGILVRPVKGTIEKAKPETVDLGIGTKWASFNVGATSAEDYGSLYAWGETDTKSSYRWSNYAYAKGTATSVIDIGSDISGTEYDVASQQWGDGWRLPTKQEINTLMSKCTFTLTTTNGVKGYKVTGPNGKSIFLPLGGCSYDGKDYGKETYTYYWSGTHDSNKQKAGTLFLKSGSGASAVACQRRTGIYVRPVKGEKVDAETEYVDLGLSVKWATCNVGANSPEGYGNLYAWGETATKASYKWSNYAYANGTAASVVFIGNSICGTQYDAARQQLGAAWRMPTESEITELKTRCTFTATTVNGVKGYTVKGPNGNSIFLPFAGCSYEGATYGKGSYAYYWSGTLSSDSQKAKALYVKSGSSTTVTECRRRTGVVIRPVFTKSAIHVTQIDGIDDNTRTESDDVFTLSGIKVDSDHLKPGIYIRNGKKFVVK